MIRNLTLSKIMLVFMLFVTSSHSVAQTKLSGILQLNADLSTLTVLPFKVVVQQTGLGKQQLKVDTGKIQGTKFIFESTIEEPENIKVTFYWKGNESTSTTFWCIPSSYQIIIGKDRRPMVQTPPGQGVLKDIYELDQQFTLYTFRAQDLVKKVNYENQKISDVEKRINFIRDSIDISLDQLYLDFLIRHPDSPSGLFALCKYAERPFGNQRFRSASAEIERLLIGLNPDIRNLPSAKFLADKLSGSIKRATGNLLADISLPDTIGKIVKISDFKGKYLLVDFWASWCMPCRAENPGLIRNFKRHKADGFQIVSITRDQPSAKGSWLQAIEKDKIGIWPQLSDFNNLAEKTYDIRFIPTNYLIDPNGIILARDLKGDDLTKKLTEIFKH